MSQPLYAYFMDGVWHGHAAWVDGLTVTMHVPPAPVLAHVVKPLPIRPGMPTVEYRADDEATIRVDGTVATPFWMIREPAPEDGS